MENKIKLKKKIPRVLAGKSNSRVIGITGKENRNTGEKEISKDIILQNSLELKAIHFQTKQTHIMPNRSNEE